MIDNRDLQVRDNRQRRRNAQKDTVLDGDDAPCDDLVAAMCRKANRM